MNKRKKMVVDHAQALFLEKGIQQTSIQDIIERAGISKGTFYNYFTSKTECVGAIMEQVRYEAGLHRSEVQLGKDPGDIEVLFEQISIIARINEQRGLSSMFEEIMHSADKELKRVVLNYRLFEFEWFANRLIDVFGIKLEPYAYEAAVLYNGMHQHLMMTCKLMNQKGVSSTAIAKSVFLYLQDIIKHLINGKTAILDPEKLKLFKSNLNHDEILREEVILLFDDLINNTKLTKSQLELTTALRDEMVNIPLRCAVVTALLQPFLDSFRGTSLYDQAKEIMSITWQYQKQVK